VFVVCSLKQVRLMLHEDTTNYFLDFLNATNTNLTILLINYYYRYFFNRTSLCQRYLGLERKYHEPEEKCVLRGSVIFAPCPILLGRFKFLYLIKGINLSPFDFRNWCSRIHAQIDLSFTTDLHVVLGRFDWY